MYKSNNNELLYACYALLVQRGSERRRQLIIKELKERLTATEYGGKL